MRVYLFLLKNCSKIRWLRAHLLAWFIGKQS